MEDLDRAGNILRIPLVSSCSERVLGVQIRKDLKMSEQVAISASRANRVLNMLRNAFTSREIHLWRNLFRPFR